MDKCQDCPMYYELTDEQKENFDGHCGCRAIESIGRCWLEGRTEDE